MLIWGWVLACLEIYAYFAVDVRVGVASVCASRGVCVLGIFACVRFGCLLGWLSGLFMVCIVVGVICLCGLSGLWLVVRYLSCRLDVL